VSESTRPSQSSSTRPTVAATLRKRRTLGRSCLPAPFPLKLESVGGKHPKKFNWMRALARSFTLMSLLFFQGSTLTFIFIEVVAVRASFENRKIVKYSFICLVTLQNSLFKLGRIGEMLKGKGKGGSAKRWLFLFFSCKTHTAVVTCYMRAAFFSSGGTCFQAAAPARGTQICGTVSSLQLQRLLKSELSDTMTSTSI
jgi:hypothetical protein